MTATLVGGLAYFGMRSFVEDKRGYLSELTTQVSANVASALAQQLETALSRLQLVASIDASTGDKKNKFRLLQDAFASFSEIRSLHLYDKTTLKVHLGEPMPEFGRGEMNQIESDDVWLHGQNIFLAYRSKERVLIACIRRERLLDTLDLMGGVGVFLVQTDGQVLLQNMHRANPIFAKAHAELLMLIQDENRLSVSAKAVTLPEGESYGAVAPIPAFESLAVIAQVQLAEVYGMLWAMARKSAFFIVSLLTICVALGFLFSARITRPIEELTKAAAQIARGQWSIQMKSKARDEIGGLVTAFVQMGAELGRREEALKAAQQKLMHAERLAALGTFGAGIAHEVKNPLNTVFGYAQLLQKKFQGAADESVTKYIGFIMDETRRASRIITDLLTFARQKPPAKAAIAPKDPLEYAKSAVSPVAQQQNVTLDVSVAQDLTPVQMDRDQIVQVLTNLMVNAVHALEEKSGDRTLSVQARGDAGWLIYEVRDNGVGIAPEVLPKLFEPFFSTKKVGKGTGLGLALCHGIIQQHGGRIEVTSQLGVGTTFQVFLPTAAA